MKKKTMLTIGGAVLAAVFGVTAFQSFADQTEPIEPVNGENELTVNEVHVASENEERAENDETNEQKEQQPEAETQQAWYDNVLSLQEAKEIALKEFQGKVIEMELDKDDGRLVYEVEIVDGNQKAEIDLDAMNGDILEVEIERENKSDKMSDVLSIQEAKDLALKEFEGKVIEIGLDKDDGRLLYEMELVNQNQKAEIDLDAVIGKVLEMEIER